MAIIDYSKIQYNPLICGFAVGCYGSHEDYERETRINEENIRKDPRYETWVKEAELHWTKFKQAQFLREQYEGTLRYRLVSRIKLTISRVRDAWYVLRNGYDE